MVKLIKTSKSRNGPDLDRYIREGKKRRYATYARAASYLSIPYYSLVHLVKEANACWKIRKTVIVDLDKLETYIEIKCKGCEENGISQK